MIGGLAHAPAYRSFASQHIMMFDQAHCLAIAVSTAFAVLCMLIDRALTKSDERAEAPQLPYRRIPAWPAVLAGSIAIATSPDTMHGLGFSFCLTTLYFGAFRDTTHRIVFPELMLLGLSVEFIIRSMDGAGSEAAMSAGVLGVIATTGITALDYFGVPQGFGDIMPAIVIGATFSPMALSLGIGFGFLAYALFAILTRKQNMADRTVPAVPGFALASLIATILATAQPNLG